MFNSGTANLTGCTISGNYGRQRRRRVQFRHGQPDPDRLHHQRQLAPRRRGGGLFNDGTANLTGCTLSGNNGGERRRRVQRLRQPDPDRLHPQRQLRGYSGGGLFNGGTANLTDCTLSGNSAGYGGGVYNDGTANLTACTVTGNSASQGGGLGIKVLWLHRRRPT